MQWGGFKYLDACPLAPVSYWNGPLLDAKMRQQGAIWVVLGQPAQDSMGVYWQLSNSFVSTFRRLVEVNLAFRDWGRYTILGEIYNIQYTIYLYIFISV